jgi:uroporphyrinogen-III synthase
LTNVLVTRPAKQAEALCQLLEQQAIRAIRFPLLDIKPLPLTFEQLLIFDGIAEQDWIIFVSTNAVQHSLTMLDGKIRAFCKKTKVAAIGMATAKALQGQGIEVNAIPEQGFTSEALLAMPEFQQINGKRIVCVRGLGGRAVLADTLRERGAQVDYLEVYQRILANSDPKFLATLLEDNALDVITLNNGEALTVLMETLESETLRRQLLAIPIIVVSERLRGQAEALGFKRVEVSENPSDSAVFNKLMSLVSGE